MTRGYLDVCHKRYSIFECVQQLLHREMNVSDGFDLDYKINQSAKVLNKVLLWLQILLVFVIVVENSFNLTYLFLPL
jgi:hypothetical protein